MQPFRFVCFWFYKLSKLAGLIFFYGFVSKLNCINQTFYLNFKLIEEHLLMAIYFKTLTTKIPNIYRNSLNRNVYLKNQYSCKLFTTLWSDLETVGVDEMFTQHGLLAYTLFKKIWTLRSWKFCLIQHSFIRSPGVSLVNVVCFQNWSED